MAIACDGIIAVSRVIRIEIGCSGDYAIQETPFIEIGQCWTCQDISIPQTIILIGSRVGLLMTLSKTCAGHQDTSFPSLSTTLPELTHL